MIVTRRGKKMSERQYLALAYAAMSRDRALPCKHGHFGCAAWEGGPCSNEMEAYVTEANDAVEEEIRQDQLKRGGH